MMRILVVALPLVACLPAWGAEAARTEIDVRLDILLGGGRVICDPAQPGHSVIGVSMAGGYKRTNDDIERHVGVFKGLRQLETGGADLSDEALAVIERMTTLEILHGAVRDDKAAARLKGLVALRSLSMGGDVTDAGLRHLAPLQNLDTLTLASSHITGAGLAQLRALPKLRSLSLREMSMGYANLKALAALQNLEVLDLAGTPVTEDGLKALGGVPSLRVLRLGGTQVKRLSVLASHAGLRELDLTNVPLTEAGVADLANLPALRVLRFGDPNVSGGGRNVDDNDLRRIGRLSALESLTVSGLFGDRGMEAIGNLTALQHLHVAGQITDAGARHLANLKALESLDLDSGASGGLVMRDGMTAGSFKDYTAAVRKPAISEATFEAIGQLPRLKSVKIVHYLSVNDAALAHLAKLPALEELSFGWQGKPTQAGFAALAQCRTLRKLKVDGGSVLKGDALAAIAQLKGLRELEVYSNELRGPDLAALKDLQALESLDLQGDSRFDAEGLSHLAALPRLRALHVNYSYDAALKGLGDLKALRSLTLGGHFTDAGLKELQSFTQLEELFVGRSNDITVPAIRELLQALPGANVRVVK